MMETTQKTRGVRALHMRGAPHEGDGVDLRMALCGWPGVDVTDVADDVTCKLCLARLAPVPASPEPEPEAWPVGEERDVERGAYALTAREAKLVTQSIAGDDEHGDRWRWRSLSAAYAQYVRVIDDGTPIRSSFRDEMPVQGGTGNTRSTGREEVIAVEVALDHAFTAPRTFRDVTLSPEEQLAIYKLVRFGRVETKRIAPGRKGMIRTRVPCSAAEVAEQDLGGRLTAHEVGLIVRSVDRMVADHLEEKRELRPRPTSDVRVTTRAEGDEMAKFPGYDCECVKDISAHLDLSESTVKKLMARQKRPLPTKRYLSFVLAKKSELDAWREAELRDPVYMREEPNEAQMQLGLPEDA